MMRGRFQELACVGLCMAIAIGTALMSYDVGMRKAEVERLTTQIAAERARIEQVRLTLQARTSLQTLEGINARYFQMNAPDRQQFFPSLAAAHIVLAGGPETTGADGADPQVAPSPDPAPNIASVGPAGAALVEVAYHDGPAIAPSGQAALRIPLAAAPGHAGDVPLRLPRQTDPVLALPESRQEVMAD